MAPPIWLHCNVCHERQARSWHISSCGHVVCQDCLHSIKTSPCGDCGGLCTRTVELNSKAPKDVQKLFSDVSADVKAVSKIIEFQEKNKASFLMAKKKKLDHIDEERSKLKREKKKKLAEIEDTKARLAAVKREIEKKKKHLASGADNPPTNPWRRFTAAASAAAHCTASFFRTEPEVINIAPPPNFTPRFSPITSPRSETRGTRYQTSTPRPPGNTNMIHKTGNHSFDADFMQLKTPAAWHRQEGRRRREGSADRRSEDRPSLDRSRVEVERIKSPVVRALDKLLGEYLAISFLASFYPNDYLADSPSKDEGRYFGRNQNHSFFTPTNYQRY